MPQTLQPTTFLELRAALSSRFRESTAAAFTAADATLCGTGIPQLDHALAGGFPRGIIATLEGAPSSGRSAIAARLLAQATARGFAAVVDDGALHPPSLAAAGVVLERLLVVCAREPRAVARAVDITIRSGVFSVVVIPAISLAGAIWTRLAGLAHRSNVLLLTLGRQASHELRYFASLRVATHLQQALWSGAAGLFGALAGCDVRATVVKHKRAAPGESAVVRCAAVDFLPPPVALRYSVSKTARPASLSGVGGFN